VSHPGFFEVRGGGSELLLADCAADPAVWERSVGELRSFVAFDLVYPALDDRLPEVAASKAEVRELADALAAEYRAFVGRHRDTPRQPPPRDAYFDSRPQAEQEQILARLRADLEREPLWGPYLERRWPDHLSDLDRAIAKLP
jgi:hypothetical protein